MSFSELQTLFPEAAEHGNADTYLFRTNIIVHYAFRSDTELTVFLPLERRTLRVSVEDEHHRNETFQGLGDLGLGVKHFFYFDRKKQVSGTIGVRLPTGRLHPVTPASYLSHHDAEALGIQIPPHSHLQLGTGTFDPFIGIQGLYRFDTRWIVFGSIDASIPFYKNKYGYRTSPSAIFQFGPAYRLPTRYFIASVFLEVFSSGRDHFEGEDITGSGGTFKGTFKVPNTGRFELAFKPGLTWGITRKLTLNVQVRIPFYTRIPEDKEQSDIQLTEPVGVILGLTYNM